MKTKHRIRFQIKDISAEGTFEGMLSPYGNLDDTGDIVEAGAFAKTLKDRGNVVPLLWQHSTSTPIGSLVLEDRPEGLWCKGELLMADAMAQRAYLFIKAKIVRGLSIGFESVKDAIENGVRRLKEVRLYEGSIVTFPANESALIASVKGHRQVKGDFNDELAEIQLGDAGYQMRCALGCALSDAIWADLTREEKIKLTEAILQQFTEAYLAYIPAYLDMLAEQYGAVETWSKQRFETKAGRKFSAATLETIKSACDSIKSGHESLVALMEAEAGDDEEEKSSTTLETKAAAPKTEPAGGHSAITNLLDQLKGELIWSHSKNN